MPPNEARGFRQTSDHVLLLVFSQSLKTEGRNAHPYPLRGVWKYKHEWL